ncbi:MAG: hypothetical protein V4539_24500 [Bacteroidota bacterium]
MVLLTVSACTHHPIPLGIVRHVPIYFHNSMLFGENIKLMEEKNEFIVATGMIDTTDEYPPVKVAFISIDKQLMQLNFMETTKNGDEITNAYYANGFTLLVSFTMEEKEDQKNIYEKAHLRIGNKDKHSEYIVFGKTGYL